MSHRPLKIPGHRPLSRPEDRDRPFSQQRRNPRVGPASRCSSRGPTRRGGSTQSHVKDLVVAREVALRRLARVAEMHAEMRQPLAEIRRELIDILLHLRIHTLEVVEAIERWRWSANRNGLPWTEPSSGENYLLRMKSDTLWLADSPLGDLLTFSPKSDPFFVVPSARDTVSRPSTANQMTPTLQARQQVRGEPRKAVLNLPTSLLQRIHKAELAILRESIQARIGGSAETGGYVETAAQQELLQVEKQIAGNVAASSPPKPASPSKVPREESAAPPAPVAVPQASKAVPVPAYTAAPVPRASKATISSIITAPKEVKSRTELPAGSPPPPFVFCPVCSTETSFGKELDRYFARVDPRVLTCLEGRKSLEELVSGGECGGAEALEFFWLFKASRSDVADGLAANESVAAQEADGLAVFQHKKASVPFGQLLHISLAGETFDAEAFYDALVTVKSFMFSCLPIKGIRVTLWYSIQPDESYNPFADLHACFKKCFFRWFQLKNTPDGRRGQVMNRPRGSPDDGDPEAPEEATSIALSWGQAWLRGGRVQDARARGTGASAWNLALSALCLHSLWSHDAAEDAKIVDWDVAAAQTAKTATREGLVMGLLTGQLSKVLSGFSPTTLGPSISDPMQGGRPKSYTSNALSASMASFLAKSLESSGSSVPSAHCEVSANVDDLVKRLSSGTGFAESCEGAGLEKLPGQASGLSAKDAAFGRMFATMDWHSVRVLDSNTFEVPVHASGKCPWHPHPVHYVLTSEDDIYIVIIPWHDIADVPGEEQSFTACTEVLRSIEPLDPPPVSTIRMSSLRLTAPVKLTEIDSGSALHQKSTSSLHVAEFGSMLLSGGRTMAGRLSAVASAAPPLVLEKPYLVGFWHAGLDGLNVPLAATLVA